jgi:uncharacterized phage-like protein YoqJ
MSTKKVVSAQAIENDSLAYSEVSALPKQSAAKAHVKTIVFAGPRPSEFPGEGWKNEEFTARARRYAMGYVKHIQALFKRVVVGANLGFEQYIVEACKTLSMPVTVIAPYRNFAQKWVDKTKAEYNTLLEGVPVIYASEAAPPPKGLDETRWAIACLQNRNKLIASEGDAFILVGQNKQTDYLQAAIKEAGKQAQLIDIVAGGFQARK